MAAVTFLQCEESADLRLSLNPVRSGRPPEKMRKCNDAKNKQIVRRVLIKIQVFGIWYTMSTKKVRKMRKKYPKHLHFPDNML